MKTLTVFFLYVSILIDRSEDMDKKARAEWDKILGKTDTDDKVELKETDYFDLKVLLKSIVCILMIIIAIIMFSLNYSSVQGENLGVQLMVLWPVLVLSLIVMILFSRPVFVFLISFMDDDIGMIVVPFVMILIMPFILLFLLINNIVSMIKNVRRPKL